MRIFFSSIKYYCLIFLLCACQPQTPNLNINDSDLSLIDGLMHYKEKPYTGNLYSKVDTITSYKVSYLEGLKHGKEQKYFFNGNIAALKYYNYGKKSGTHRSWWDKGRLKSEYHFDNFGNYIGQQREWYNNGQLVKELYYSNGKEDGTQKSWGPQGEIISNYQVINGESFGLIGSKKCKSISDD